MSRCRQASDRVSFRYKSQLLAFTSFLEFFAKSVDLRDEGRRYLYRKDRGLRIPLRALLLCRHFNFPFVVLNNYRNLLGNYSNLLNLCHFLIKGRFGLEGGLS